MYKAEEQEEWMDFPDIMEQEKYFESAQNSAIKPRNLHINAFALALSSSLMFYYNNNETVSGSEKKVASRLIYGIGYGVEELKKFKVTLGMNDDVRLPS